MNDETLMKISLVGAVVFFIASIFAYENAVTPISSVNSSYIGKFTCVKGNYSFEKDFKSCILGKITDKTGKINIFVCNNTNAYKIFKKKKFLKNVKICGKIKSYKDSLEIIPAKISYS